MVLDVVDIKERFEKILGDKILKSLIICVVI